MSSDLALSLALLALARSVSHPSSLRAAPHALREREPPPPPMASVRGRGAGVRPDCCTCCHASVYMTMQMRLLGLRSEGLVFSCREESSANCVCVGGRCHAKPCLPQLAAVVAGLPCHWQRCLRGCVTSQHSICCLRRVDWLGKAFANARATLTHTPSPTDKPA